MNEFAHNVFNYFVDKIAETGLPLTEREGMLFEQARSCMRRFPISCLTHDDLDYLGFETKSLNNDKMRRLAEKLGDDYHEQLYWTSLEVLGEKYEIPKKTLKNG